VIVVVATAIGTLMQTRSIRADMTLRIDSEVSKIIPFKDGTFYDSGDSDYFQTQLELLKSRVLAERVVAQMKLKPAAVTSPPARPWWEELLPQGRSAGRAAFAGRASKAGVRNVADSLRGGLVVSPVKNTKMVRLSYASASPRLAADVLNAVAQTFINYNLEQRYDQSSYAKTFLEEKLAETKAKLESNERALIEFQRANAIVSVDDRQTVLSTTLSDYTPAANKAEQELSKAEALYELTKTNPESAPQVLESKTVQALKEQKAKLQADYADNLRDLQARLSEDAAAAVADRRARPQHQGRDRRVKRSVETSYESLQTQQKGDPREARADEEGRSRPAGRSIQYNILKRDVDTDRAIYNSLLHAPERGRRHGRHRQPTTSPVVDRAEIPPAPFKPDLRQNLIIAMLLGLIGGVALAFFLEHLDDTIRMPETWSN
jgi:uncharacterized protein involved in exopolysaccharide biosynthesis